MEKIDKLIKLYPLNIIQCSAQIKNLGVTFFQGVKIKLFRVDNKS